MQPALLVREEEELPFLHAATASENGYDDWKVWQPDDIAIANFPHNRGHRGKWRMFSSTAAWEQQLQQERGDPTPPHGIGRRRRWQQRATGKMIVPTEWNNNQQTMEMNGWGDGDDGDGQGWLIARKEEKDGNDDQTTGTNANANADTATS